MILRSIILFVIAVGLILYTVGLVRKRKALQNQWMAAVRHVVALIAGWIAFGILSGLVVLLDLFESNEFSLVALANGLVVPLIIFIAGMIVVRIALIGSSD